MPNVPNEVLCIDGPYEGKKIKSDIISWNVPLPSNAAYVDIYQYDKYPQFDACPVVTYNLVFVMFPRPLWVYSLDDKSIIRFEKWKLKTGQK